MTIIYRVAAKDRTVFIYSFDCIRFPSLQSQELSNHILLKENNSTNFESAAEKANYLNGHSINVRPQS